jgi:hypothetical protein
MGVTLPFNVIYVKNEWEHFRCEMLMKNTVNNRYNGSGKKIGELLIKIFEKRR